MMGEGRDPSSAVAAPQGAPAGESALPPAGKRASLPVGVVLVPGTHGWRGLSTRGQWWQAGSPFVQMLEASGVCVRPPYVWTTDLAGTWWTGRREWEAAGLGLVTHLAHYGQCEGGDGVHVISHSHGGQVTALAASLGAEIRSWVSVAMPVRDDLMPVYYAARRHVRDWLHIYSAGWRDRMQIWGGLFDGHLGVQRDLPLPPHPGHTHVNHRLTGVGHSDVLYPPHLRLWREAGWLAYLVQHGGDPAQE